MKNFKNSDSKSYILTLLKKSLYNTHPVPSYQILISILVSEKKSHYSYYLCSYEYVCYCILFKKLYALFLYPYDHLHCIFEKSFLSWFVLIFSHLSTYLDIFFNYLGKCQKFNNQLLVYTDV